jgi:hypothetical protein
MKRCLSVLVMLVLIVVGCSDGDSSGSGEASPAVDLEDLILVEEDLPGYRNVGPTPEGETNCEGEEVRDRASYLERVAGDQFLAGMRGPLVVSSAARFEDQDGAEAYLDAIRSLLEECDNTLEFGTAEATTDGSFTELDLDEHGEETLAVQIEYEWQGRRVTAVNLLAVVDELVVGVQSSMVGGEEPNTDFAEELLDVVVERAGGRTGAI